MLLLRGSWLKAARCAPMPVGFLCRRSPRVANSTSIRVEWDGCTAWSRIERRSDAVMGWGRGGVGIEAGRSGKVSRRGTETQGRGNVVPAVAVVVTPTFIPSHPRGFARKVAMAVAMGSDLSIAPVRQCCVRRQSWLGISEDGRRRSQRPQRYGIHADVARSPCGDQRQLQIRGFGQNQVGQHGFAALGEDLHG